MHASVVERHMLIVKSDGFSPKRQQFDDVIMSQHQHRNDVISPKRQQYNDVVVPKSQQHNGFVASKLPQYNEVVALKRQQHDDVVTPKLQQYNGAVARREMSPFKSSVSRTHNHVTVAQEDEPEVLYARPRRSLKTRATLPGKVLR